MLGDIVSVNRCGRLRLLDHFSQLFILLLDRANIAVDVRKTIFEIVDLVIQNFIMSMNCNLAIDEGIYSFGNFIEVLIVQFIHLLNQCLRSACCHGWILCRLLMLRLLLVHLLLLLLAHLILLLTGNLLISPCALVLWLLLLLLGGSGRSECNRCACFSHDLLKRIIRAPLLDQVSLNALALLIDVGEGVEDLDVHLHVEVNARGLHREVRRQDDLQGVLVGLSLHHQVVGFRLAREC